MWCSKQKYTIRTSTIGQEFIVTKAAPEMIQPLQYKLHKMGIPINGPTNMFGDNEAVVRNSVMSETILKVSMLLFVITVYMKPVHWA